MTLNEFKKQTQNMNFAEFKRFCVDNYGVLPPDPQAYNNSSYHSFLEDYERFEKKIAICMERQKTW